MLKIPQIFRVSSSARSCSRRSPSTPSRPPPGTSPTVRSSATSGTASVAPPSTTGRMPRPLLSSTKTMATSPGGAGRRRAKRSKEAAELFICHVFRGD
ncbi:RNA-binding protein 25-like [Iris pallida]|uniref:RNA-binding protein 25-like n=1 Tax=Iris pallida TaxID=29817 RepID=A0AAX6FKW4_IRIPA|nr:RNA-binding protein 25-like [Iris pallida]